MRKGSKHSIEMRAQISQSMKRYRSSTPPTERQTETSKLNVVRAQSALWNNPELVSEKREACRRLGISNAGSNNPAWNGGISHNPYRNGFKYTLREKIRDRDGRKCTICGKPEGKRKLTVHHVDHDQTNNEEWNLITVCQSCHTMHHKRHKNGT